MTSIPFGQLYRTLTRELSRRETRSIEDGPTPDELALEAQWADELESILIALYLLVVVRLDQLPRTSEAAVRAWLEDQYRADPLATVPLLLSLQTWLRRGVDLGGASALELLGYGGLPFHLTDPVLLAAIDAFATQLVTIGGDLSLLDTTIDDLSSTLWGAIAADPAVEVAALATAVQDRAAVRSALRANLIAESEISRSLNAGLVWTYDRNGVPRVQFWPREDACDICEPDRGKAFPVTAIPAAYEIPRHVRCRCIWLPVGFESVSVVWTGGTV